MYQIFFHASIELLISGKVREPNSLTLRSSLFVISVIIRGHAHLEALSKSELEFRHHLYNQSLDKLVLLDYQLR